MGPRVGCGRRLTIWVDALVAQHTRRVLCGATTAAAPSVGSVSRHPVKQGKRRARGRGNRREHTVNGGRRSPRYIYASSPSRVTKCPPAPPPPKATGPSWRLEVSCVAA